MKCCKLPALTEENAEEIAMWCKGKIVREIDETDPEVQHVAINFQGLSEVERLHKGETLVCAEGHNVFYKEP